MEDDVLATNEGLCNENSNDKHQGENKEWGTLNEFEKDGLWGFIDNCGMVIVEPQYLYVRPFSEGLAFVRGVDGNDHQTGFIDLTGTLVIPLPNIFSALNFSEGFASIREWDADRDVWRSPWDPIEIGSMGYMKFIDRTGRDVFNQKFHSAGSFSEGLAIVRFLEHEDGYQAGFIDTTGEVVISLPVLIQGSSFSEGFAHIIVREWAADDEPKTIGLPGPFIFIDRTGQDAFGMEFDSAGRFENGFAPVNVGGRRQYLDRYGNLHDRRPS